MPRRSTPESSALAIGQRIRALREEQGLTQEQLAFESDFSKGHLSSLERGLVMPTVEACRCPGGPSGCARGGIGERPRGE